MIPTFAAWVIGVSIVTRSNAGMVLANIARQANATDASVTRLQRRMNGLHGTAKIADRALTGAGVAAAAAFAVGIKGAADLQTATIQTAIALGRQGKTLEDTMRNMREFRSIAISMSNMSGQNVVDSMGLLATMAGPGGITASKLLNGGRFEGSLAKVITQYADAQRFGKDHVPFADSVKTATTLAHDLQWFNPQQMAHGLNELNKASIVSTRGVKMMATQIRMFAPSFRKAGMSPDDTVLFAAWADRMGFGTGRGGTGLNMIAKNLVAPRGKVKSANLYNLGIYDDPKATTSRFINPHTGQIDLLSAIDYLAKADLAARSGGAMIHGRRVEGAQFDQFFARAFDTNAANVMGTIATHGGLSQLSRIRAQMGLVPDLQSQQATLMQGLNEQTTRLTSSFRTLVTLLESKNAERLAGVMTGAADRIGGMVSYFNAHPKQADAAGIGLGALGAMGLFKLAQFGDNFVHTFAVLGGKHPHFGAGLGHLFRRRGTAVAEEAAEVAAGGSRGGVVRSVADTLGRALSLRATRNAVGSGWQRVAPVARRIPGAGLLDNVLSSFGRMFAATAGRISGIAARFTGGIGLVGEFLAKVGLRFIPLVGEVLLFVDALNFLGHHTKDIGHAIGVAGFWIRDNVPKLLGAAWQIAITTVIPAAKSAMLGLLQEIISVINPANWAGAITNLVHGVVSGFHDAENQERYLANQHAKTEAGRYAPPMRVAPRGNPFAIPQARRSPGEQFGARYGPKPAALGPLSFVLPGARPQRVDTNFGRGQTGPTTVNVHVQANYSAPAGESDALHRRRALAHARDVAQSVAREIAAVARNSGRAAGSVIQPLGMSPLELSPSQA